MSCECCNVNEPSFRCRKCAEFYVCSSLCWESSKLEHKKTCFPPSPKIENQTFLVGGRYKKDSAAITAAYDFFFDTESYDDSTLMRLKSDIITMRKKNPNSQSWNTYVDTVEKYAMRIFTYRKNKQKEEKEKYDAKTKEYNIDMGDVIRAGDRLLSMTDSEADSQMMVMIHDNHTRIKQHRGELIRRYVLEKRRKREKQRILNFF